MEAAEAVPHILVACMIFTCIFGSEEKPFVKDGAPVFKFGAEYEEGRVFDLKIQSAKHLSLAELYRII
jgi:hypothetical protein